MQKYYDKNGVTLYLGDCREIDVPHDLLVTDPPYGQKFESGKAGGKWGAIVGDDDLDGVHERLLHTLKSLREARHCYIFGHALDVTKLPLGGMCTLVWDKGMVGMGDLTLPWGPQHEQITFGVLTRSKANRAKGYGNLAARMRKGSVLRSLRPNSRGVKHHPTEKPVDILRQLIESSSVMGETVYDPFAGSGSTLIATALEGRIAVGCEIEERYCEAAAKRFETELSLLAA
jgi:site-specific DNA-methyltransferase (adenine-specific)